jgi:hypothetical protein
MAILRPRSAGRRIASGSGWRCRAAGLLLAAGAVVFAQPARAQALESVLAPGALSTAHAKYEEECQKCHVRFDRNAQDRLCMECHKDIGQDMRSKTGLHARLKPQACRSCHSDHKGRDFQLAPIDKAKFDHALTNFALRDGHRKVECASCHVPGKGYRVPQHDCVSCHRKDDVHKGSLGAKCADCHGEVNWKTTRFDHSTTHFPLTGKHENVKCVDCHSEGHYKDTPMACVACHRKVDKHKGQFGDKCETCHTTRDWTGIRFNHDTDTRYPLLGKHRTTKCESCHTGPLYRDKLPTTCVDCHRKDDKHKGSLGTECARCHSERDWKEPAKFSHDKTAFPLLGAHATVQCKSCHASTMFKEAPKTCIGCHRKDDVHKGSLSESCGECHNERQWKTTNLDHSKTAFPLLGKHLTTACDACHKSKVYKDAPKDCYSCHRTADKHEGQQGRLCAACHDATSWKSVARFDHGLTKFPLLGKHAAVECKSCHVSALFKNAKSDCYSCHAKDDKHQSTLGAACEQCHNARSWKAWDFDHDKRTKFVLDGKHQGLTCNACHTRPVVGRLVLSSQCITCHAKNDVHEGSYGKQCQQCHVTSSFKTIKARPGRAVSSLAPAMTRRAAVALRVPAMSRWLS